MTLGRNMCPDLQCPLKFKSNHAKIGFLSGSWCHLALGLIASSIHQILSKLTLIFFSTECEIYRKSRSKSLSCHPMLCSPTRNGKCVIITPTD